jgi:phosphoribosylformylglycinamidine synthase subunit PurSL
VACGMNPRLADFDAYHMAASAIDEAVRNCVAVGADPARIAILDNFCWGNTERPTTLGSLVRAALACHELAVALGTPFISGKDSLNNEFRFADLAGETRSIAIPPSLLISALGQLEDVERAVTMDLKEAGNRIYLVGETKNEMGGSHFALVHGLGGGHVPEVDSAVAKRTFAAIHQAIRAGLVRACHDLSEGGLAASVAEMAFAGGLGANVELDKVPQAITLPPSVSHEPLPAILLFAESNSRFLCEVARENAAEFERLMAGVPCGCLGRVTENADLEITLHGHPLVLVDVERLKAAWQAPLNWS